MRVHASVEFASLDEATRWLAAYCSPVGPTWRAIAAEFNNGPGELLATHSHGVETRYIAKQAALMIYEHFCVPA